MASTSRAAYAAHLQGTIIPNLHSARDAMARIDADIHEYEQVARRLSREKDKDTKGKERMAPVEIGAGVWGDAIVDTTTVTLDLGLDIHLALPAPEAATYAAKRAAVLRKKRDAVAKRAEQLQWEAEQFTGAIKGEAREQAREGGDGEGE